MYVCVSTVSEFKRNPWYHAKQRVWISIQTNWNNQIQNYGKVVPIETEFISILKKKKEKMKKKDIQRWNDILINIKCKLSLKIKLEIVTSK